MPGEHVCNHALHLVRRPRDVQRHRLAPGSDELGQTLRGIAAGCGDDCLAVGAGVLSVHMLATTCVQYRPLCAIGGVPRAISRPRPEEHPVTSQTRPMAAWELRRLVQGWDCWVGRCGILLSIDLLPISPT